MGAGFSRGGEATKAALRDTEQLDFNLFSGLAGKFHHFAMSFPVALTTIKNFSLSEQMALKLLGAKTFYLVSHLGLCQLVMTSLH